MSIEEWILLGLAVIVIAGFSYVWGTVIYRITGMWKIEKEGKKGG